MTDIVDRPSLQSAAPKGTPRSFIMCRPTHFRVEYAINAWMDTSVPVDTDLAVEQWEALRDTYLSLGHKVFELEPLPDCPDMVFAANGAFSVGGTVYGAKFKYPERALEATAHRAWYASARWKNFTAGRFVNEGEGDFTYLPALDLVLAGHGFRTEIAAHVELEQVIARPVWSLELVDDRFYHLDTALFVLTDDNVCYFPEAFSAETQRQLAEVFPGAVLAAEEDALAFGLNSVSDGVNVIVPAGATGLADQLRRRGFKTHLVDTSELIKGGGSVKCCTAELRP